MARRIVRWEFWAALGLSALIGVLLTGGILFGWATADAGFMKYCPEQTTPNHIIRYFYVGNDPRDQHAQGPCKELLFVGLDPERRPWKVLINGDDDLVEATYAAMDGLNRNAGCKLFMAAGDMDIPDAVISKGAYRVGNGSQPGGTTSHRLSDGRWLADVVIYNVATAADLHRAIMHELGHVVGLAHDSFKDSLMYRGSSGSSRLTDSDRKLLNDWYCER